MTTDLRLAIMARAPQPGAAKTRLIPRLGAQRAAQLHAALVRHALGVAAEFRDRRPPAGIDLWCAPDCAHPFFAQCADQFGVTLRPQPAGDLGQRMAHVFANADAPTLLIGTDCPTIDAPLLLRCADALATGAPAAFLPAEDGGYGLVGLRAPIPQIFADMPWGTDRVMAQTRARLARLGITHAEPAIVWDVDRPDDVDRLAASGFPIP